MHFMEEKGRWSVFFGIQGASWGGSSSRTTRGTAAVGPVNGEASLSWITGLVGKALRYVAVL